MPCETYQRWGRPNGRHAEWWRASGRVRVDVRSVPQVRRADSSHPRGGVAEPAACHIIVTQPCKIMLVWNCVNSLLGDCLWYCPSGSWMQADIATYDGMNIPRMNIIPARTRTASGQRATMLYSQLKEFHAIYPSASPSRVAARFALRSLPTVCFTPLPCPVVLRTFTLPVLRKPGYFPNILALLVHWDQWPADHVECPSRCLHTL